jgi:hypothetical protein
LFIQNKTEGKLMADFRKCLVLAANGDSDTIFDRTKILNEVKAKKPWNMTAAERERTGHV